MASGGTIVIDVSACDPLGFLGINPLDVDTPHGHASAYPDASWAQIQYVNNGDGASTDTFQFEDADGVSHTITVNIGAASSPISLSPGVLATPSVGTAYSATLSASGGTAPYTYTLDSGALPRGLTLSGDTIGGTPDKAGTFSFTIKATDDAGLTGIQSYSVTVPVPTITVAPLPTAAANVPYNQTLSASGGLGPYTYTLESGTLPTGLSLSGGVISGTPTVLGSYDFAIRATDSSPAPGGPYFGVTNFTVAVQNTPPTAGDVTATVAYGSSNNPIALNITGTPATSVAIVTPPEFGTASVTGTSITFTPKPGFAGADPFTYQASNGAGDSSPATVTVTVLPPTIAYAPASPATATVGTAYGDSLAGASGGAAPYTYEIASGSLPPGITLASDGTLAGTATAGGAFGFTVRVTDSSSGDGPFTATSTALTLTVSAPSIVITPASLPNATVGATYAQTVTASGGTDGYTYAVTAGALPAGLTLDSSGALSGTPTAGGSYNFTITAVDSSTGTGPYSGSQAYTLTVLAPTLTLTPASGTTLDATAGSPVSGSFTAANGTAPYSYSIGAGALPPGVTLSPTGALSGSPTAAGNYNFEVQATDNSTGPGAPFIVTGSYTLAVVPPTITLSPGILPAPAVGDAYSQTITASEGHPTTFTYAVTSGVLPAGLSLDSGSGTLSGTPTAAGTFSFTLTATDGGGFTGSQAYSLTVAAGTVVLDPGAPADATAGAPYAGHAFVASGGTAPYTYAMAGTLPAGMTLSAAGELSGTPTVTGTFNFIVTATDSSTGVGAPFSTSQAYSLTVNAPTITLSPGVLPAPAVGNAYSQTVTASEGHSATFTYNVTSGVLPAGLSLDSGSGTLSGTPTAAGTFSFTLTATDGGGFTGSQAYSLTVGAGTVVLDPGAPADATAEASYGGHTFAASGGTAPYSYAVTAGALPAGMTLSSAGGLSGTPTVAGSFNFTVTATDSSTGAGAPFSASQAYSLTVSAPAITVAPATLPAGTGGVAYNQTISASGGNGSYSYNVSAGALPPGVALSSAGLVSGTPTTAGTYNATITATDGFGFTGSQTYALVVQAPTISLSPTTLPAGVGGVAYSQTLSASGGNGGYTYSLTSGPLPPGIVLSNAGLVSGTPTTAGTYNVTITATDGFGFTCSQTYTFVVQAPTISISPATLPAGVGGVAYNQTVSASGGNGGYTYSLASGALPAGMALSPAGGLSGTPTTTGSFDFTITATDGFGFTGSQPYTFAVNAPTVTITPATLPGGQVATAYSQTLSASGGNGGYTYSLASGTLPPGVVLSSAGTLSGTPGAAGSYSFTVKATDGFGFSGSRAYSVGIDQPVPVAVKDDATTAANAPVTIPVTANDTGPITRVAVAQAPAHGTAAVDGLDVVYTPAANFFGNDSFTYTAIGPGGTSAPATVSVAVTPLAVPVATAKSAKVLAGKSVTIHAAAGASHGPFTAVTVVKQPVSGTVTTRGMDLVYTADADASGTFGFDYTLSNAFGASKPAHITVTVNPRPVAPALKATAIAGTTVQVDLTAKAQGGPFTGAKVVSVSPANAGSATVKADGDGGYTMAFAASPTFGGMARITYTLSNAFATSEPGTVDVTVKLRSDPSKNAEVLGVLNAQAEAARRMARGQIGNFQRRLESLHGGGSRAGFSNGITMHSASRQRRPDTRVGMQQGMGGGGDPFMAPNDAAANERTPSSAGSAPDGLAFWTGGAVNFGKLEPGTSDNGIDFTTAGVSLGADKQVTRALALGLGLGYGHDASDIGRHGSRSTVDSYNVAAYGSYQPDESTYVDALAGYQWLQFDARRFVTDNGNTVLGRRDGKQWFASLSVGYRHQADGMLLTPYGRLDIARATLDGYTETGDEVFALNYRSQTVKTSTGTVGLLAQWTVKRDYGVWAPQLRAEFGHDMQGSSQAMMQYADLLSGPLYRATLTRQSRNHTLLGAGVALQTLKGWSLRAEYQSRLDNTSRDNQSIMLGVQKALP